MGDTSLIRTALLVALIAAFGLAAAGRAPAAESPASACASVPGIAISSDDQLPSALRTGMSDSGCAFQPFCWAMT
jgi:hypothetical protein